MCVHDEAAVIWAGEETPCALGVVCSLGSINQANNAALTAAISELIEPFGVKADRMYLNVCPPRPPRNRVTARTAPHRTAPHRIACLHALLALPPSATPCLWVATAGDSAFSCLLASHAVLRRAARELRLVRTHLRGLRSDVAKRSATVWSYSLRRVYQAFTSWAATLRETPGRVAACVSLVSVRFYPPSQRAVFAA